MENLALHGIIYVQRVKSLRVSLAKKQTTAWNVNHSCANVETHFVKLLRGTKARISWCREALLARSLVTHRISGSSVSSLQTKAATNGQEQRRLGRRLLGTTLAAEDRFTLDVSCVPFVFQRRSTGVPGACLLLPKKYPPTHPQEQKLLAPPGGWALP